MHFITQATPGIWRKFQKLEAGPQNPQSTFLVEEAFRVSNNQDLMAETNEDRRLVKRMQLLTALISRHLKETLESQSRTLHQEAAWARTTVPTVRGRGTGRENALSTLLWDAQERTPTCPHFSSVAQSCPTFCNPMNRRTPGLPVHHQLPEFTQTHVHRVSDAIQPAHPLSSPSPPAPNPSQHQSLFQ